MTPKSFDVIIIGGSYSGLSAAMALGRAVRQVLVIDSGKPCNSPAPHSHNFITHDGETPAQIRASAKAQVQNYPTVHFRDGVAEKAIQKESRFEITMQSGETVESKKLIIATGLRDILPDINGFAECWGKSIIHCPYCHGYEVRNVPTGIFANGDGAFHYAQLISHWTKDLTVFTNGKSTLTPEQSDRISAHHIKVVETEIERIAHDAGQIDAVLLKDGSQVSVKAVYTRPDFAQHSAIPASLGCEMTEQGLIKVDIVQRTSVKGVYACGDNSSARFLAVSVATGGMAGAASNNDMIMEEF